MKATPEVLASTIRLATAVKLYEMGQLSSGAASQLAGVPIEVVDRLMSGDRPDPVLILCKAVGLDWATTRSLILAGPAATGITALALESAADNFDKLPVASAKRVVRFWQAGEEYRA